MNKKNIIIGYLGFLLLPLLANAQSEENYYVNLTVISQRAEGSAAQEWNDIYYSIDQIVGTGGSNSFLLFAADLTQKNNEKNIQLPANGDESYYIRALLPAVGWNSPTINCTSSDSETEVSIYYEVKIVPAYGKDTAVICTYIYTNDGVQPSAKTPVLFVPGLMGTKIKQGNELIWLEPGRVVNPFDSDDFLNSLIFDTNLLSIKDLSLAGIIKKEIYAGQTYDYTDGLINEFKNQGYITDDGAVGQDFFTFPYDWRYGVSGVYPQDPNSCAAAKTNATLLRDKINQLAVSSSTHKVNVIAHSMGGLIVKKYIMDSNDSGDSNDVNAVKIDKLVFVGVPNLGSPVAAKALLMGHDFDIFGLNPAAIKKISQNMPAAYDLLPTTGYSKSFLNVMQLSEDQRSGIDKDLTASEAYIQMKKRGLNSTAMDNAINLQSSMSSGSTDDFENYDVRAKGVDAYNIVGCKSATLGNINELDNSDGSLKAYDRGLPITGDDTVPFESADSIKVDNSHKFYAIFSDPLIPIIKHGHGDMPSFTGVRQKITGIITGKDFGQFSNIINYETLAADINKCQIFGDQIELHSPVDIFVTDQYGNQLGYDTNGNLHKEIPGADFDIANDHKYLFLPNDIGERYAINLKGNLTGADNGTFTLIDKKINGDRVESVSVFNNVSVKSGNQGNLNLVSGQAPQLKFDSDNNGISEIIPVASELSASQAGDLIPPATTAMISGNAIAPFYKDDVTVTFSGADFAQSGVTPSEVASISYVLDGGKQIIISGMTANINVGGEGNHNLVFFATDNLANVEEQKSISFTIDKTPPELKFGFDRTKNDLAFFAVDNYSASNTIVIVDNGGSVSAIDQAGNETRLSFSEKNRRQSLRAQLSGLSYNGQAVDWRGSQLAFSWFYGYTPKLPLILSGLQSLPAIPKTLPKTGPLSFLLQQAKLKDGSFVVALFGNNKTLLLEYKNKKLNLKTFSGLKLVDFLTDKGKLSWSY